MGKNTKQNTQTQTIEQTQLVEQLTQKIDLLTKQVDTIEQNKQKQVNNIIEKVKQNTCYSIIEKFCNDNKLTLKPLNNEYNKQYVQLQGRNVFFVLFKSNNIVSLYLNYKHNDSFIYSSYNKRLCYRGNLNLEQLTEQLQTIYDTSLQNLNSKTVTSSNLINEYKTELEQLKKQLEQLQNK